MLSYYVLMIIDNAILRSLNEEFDEKIFILKNRSKKMTAPK